MKVTSVDTVLTDHVPVLVRMETDAGITGVGECLPDVSPMVAAAIEKLAGYLVG